MPQSRTGFIDQLGLEVHFVNESEFFKTPTDDFRVIDFNSISEIAFTGQSVIRMREDAGNTGPPGSMAQLGVTDGSLGRPNQTPDVSVFANVISAISSGAANGNFSYDMLYDWVISHEVGHAVDICHRQENENGVPVDEHTGNPLPNPTQCPEDGGEMVPQARIPNGVFVMHSGYVIQLIKEDGRYLTHVNNFHAKSKNQIRVNSNQ